ncbi:MAG: c-type cytochrome [Aphanocapsa feldmannii 288cV]|nr:MAG: c-type cytochrome [Aphanocapsa feldmannii 288cV]
MKINRHYKKIGLLGFFLISLTVLVLLSFQARPQSGFLTGGNTTVIATGRMAFSYPLANIDRQGNRIFGIGNSFFKRNWVEAPASTTARDGLGPHFIARACAGCHLHDGRGAPPAENQDAIALLIRLSIPGEDNFNGAVPEPVYGNQFNNFAISNVKPEGNVEINYQDKIINLNSGKILHQKKPSYQLTNLQYGPMHDQVMLSPRIAPHIAGIGLLESIRDEDIIKNEVQQLHSKGPVKGHVNYVWDSKAKKKMIGRFGWKANVATIAHQTAAAFVGDIGITSTLFPAEQCTIYQTDCLESPTGSDRKNNALAKNSTTEGPEIDDDTLNHVIFYQAAIAPAARRNIMSKSVNHGEKLFNTAGCATCHLPSYTTGKQPFSELQVAQLVNEKIWPYTDLLLHDMGPDLADGRPDFKASGREWKTPPLWGVGLFPDVNGHQRLLHDGRADGVLDAILWHSGEAEQAKQKVLSMSDKERDHLVDFVNSL